MAQEQEVVQYFSVEFVLGGQGGASLGSTPVTTADMLAYFGASLVQVLQLPGEEPFKFYLDLDARVMCSRAVGPESCQRHQREGRTRHGRHG